MINEKFANAIQELINNNLTYLEGWQQNELGNKIIEIEESNRLEKLVSLPSGFIEDFITQRLHLKKGERVECSKDKLVEILNDFVKENMIDLEYYKIIASDESELSQTGFNIKMALRDLITDIERSANLMVMPTMYTILDEIDFEKQCNVAHEQIVESEFNAQQYIFGIIQKFYKKLKEKLKEV